MSATTAASGRFAMMIDGAPVEGGEAPFDVINPFDGSVVAKAPTCSKADLDKAVSAARTAFKSWSALSFEDRKGYLKKMAEVTEKNKDALAELLVLEQGKGRIQADYEIMAAQGWFQNAIDAEHPNKLFEDTKEQKVQKLYRPLGVVGCITAWNFPIALMAFKISFGLLSGCTIILKPSENTPLCTLELARLYNEVLPPGVLSVVTSEKKELGEWLVKHPGIDKISFTGSTATGKRIMQTAAESLKRVTLELGGNDPAIVLPDADPAKVAPGIFQAAFFNSGQVCIAAKRIFVPESIFDATVEAFANEAKNAPFGNGLDKGVVFGPLNNGMQYDRVRELLMDALDNGAEMVVGEVPPPREDAKGYMIKPVVLKNVKEGMRIVDEEQFGPVMPVMSYKTVDEAIERANNTEYGLGASVWTSDLDKGDEVAAQINAGTVWVNTHGEIDGTVAFGGAKCSGVGHEGGTEGLLAFLQLHVVKTKRVAAL
ncbi:Aldehyde dehydrogenase [Hondaea fermentalgiana]|uniref:Aldehyde dehydrogenase n=1 Tax=Hondaea fermentalgiana TaxID=2315210 RepID=A0A2R5H0S5_9STRA|nr:Aldehyde dehydrogenase [Hondaea fermentalgiana]|eukprot:GBG34371.1 Aldehyde dehydrogenase [Hondaea fermentalgiana]